MRVAIKPDSLSDNKETFTLSATNPKGVSGVGTATIVDDFTGDLYSATNITGLPDPLGSQKDLPAILDDDRPLSVTSPKVNEGSPYVVFSVTGAADQRITLDKFADGTAKCGVDYGTIMEIHDAITGWRSYTPGQGIVLDGSGKLLVRSTITDDQPFDNNETFHLTAKNIGGGTATGTATILVDGSGLFFSKANITGTPNTLGAFSDLPAVPDDDRPIPAPISLAAQHQVLCIEELFASQGFPNILYRLSGADMSADRINNHLANLANLT